MAAHHSRPDPSPPLPDSLLPCGQAELAERHLQRLWDREATAAAERCGVDLMTYTTLLELQHRDITPEDYDILQELDSNTKVRKPGRGPWLDGPTAGLPLPYASPAAAPRWW